VALGRRSAVGFTDATVTYTQEAAPGMHAAIVRATKPAGSWVPLRAATRRTRYEGVTADSEGNGATRFLAGSNTSRRGPHHGCARRSSAIATSTAAGI
jgi:hypothetical protein